jgi:hypothetical protein
MPEMNYIPREFRQILTGIFCNGNSLLRIISISYLLLPNFIFLATWLNPVIGIISVFLLLLIFFRVVLYEEIKNNVSVTHTEKNNKLVFLILSLIALGLCFCFGIGEFRPQVVDWGANNFKIYDLVTKEWPLYYENLNAYGCYYWGYYLPTAFLGKILGLAYSKYIILLWSWVGVFLILIWLFDIRKSFFFIVLFLLFNNANTVFFLIDKLNIPFFQHFMKDGSLIIQDLHINIWSPMVTSLRWVPQHLIPGGIATLFLIHKSQTNNFKQDVLIFLSTMIWSPIISIGLTPFMLARLWINRREILLFKNLHSYILIGLPFISIVLYLTANNTIKNTTNANHFIWDNSLYWLPAYVLFVVFNLLIWGFLLKSHFSIQNSFLLIAFLVIPLLALYKLGIGNDLLFRGSIPAFIIVGVAVAKQSDDLRKNTKKRITFIMWISCFLFYALPSIYTIGKGFLPGRPATTIEYPFTQGSTNIMDYLNIIYEPTASEQYKLKENSIFEKYLMKHHQEKGSNLRKP